MTERTAPSQLTKARYVMTCCTGRSCCSHSRVQRFAVPMPSSMSWKTCFHHKEKIQWIESRWLMAQTPRCLLYRGPYTTFWGLCHLLSTHYIILVHLRLRRRNNTCLFSMPWTAEESQDSNPVLSQNQREESDTCPYAC